MKRIVFLLLATTFFFCAPATARDGLEPKSPFSGEGIHFLSPDEPGWTIERSGKSETIFEKMDASGKEVATVRTIEIPAVDN